MNNAAELDIGPLSWVKGEIDLALERAAEALDRHRADGAQEGDSSHLKSARNNLHQAHGALSIVGLDGVTQFSDALEQLLKAVEEGSVVLTPAVAETAQHGLSAIRHYLDDLVNGQPDQPLKLLPAYRAVAAARGLPEPPPSELFFPDMSLRPPRREQEPPPLSGDALLGHLRAARAGFEHGLLKWLRDGDAVGIPEMRQAVASIELSQAQAGGRAFWWIALGVLDAMAAGGLPNDLSVKRLCARVDIQMKRLSEGARTVAERLMRDALYYVATATRQTGDQVECIRAAYRLHGLIPKSTTTADADAIRPALRACHELLTQAMDDWNRFCAGTAAALPQFHGHLSRLVTQAQALRQHEIPHLVASLAAVADLLRKNPLRHDESIAIEVATALLLAEHALDAYEHLGPEFADQVATIVARLSALVKGESLGALELPQLDAISKKAQERLVMNQVVKEIVVNLSVIEQALDAFFRDNSKRAELAGLDKPLKQVHGALMILGQARTTAVLAECEASIGEFASDNYAPQQSDFESVARKLSAIGFFVEQLKYGAADIDAILNPARAAVELEEDEYVSPPTDSKLQATARMAQSIIGALREKPEDEGLREEIKQSLETLREDAWLRADLAVEEKATAAIAAIDTAQPAADIEAAVAEISPPPAATAVPSAQAVRLVEASSEEVDAELLDIFIEEAHEVLATIGDLGPVFAAQPHDHRETLTTIRRGFHTLKGSGRMVGLAELGEAAWAVEQVLNRWLRQELEATPALHRMVSEAHALFRNWVAQLEAGGGIGYDATALVASCERLKSGGEVLPDPVPVETPSAEADAVTTAEAVEQTPIQAAASGPAPEPKAAVPESVTIGNVVLSPALYNMFLKESQTHIATLRRELESIAPPDPVLVRAAHTLAGISGTAGIAAVNGLGHALEAALNRLAKAGVAPSEGQRLTFARAVGALEGMIGAIAERRMPPKEEALAAELDNLIPPEAGETGGGIVLETPLDFDFPAMGEAMTPEEIPAAEEIVLAELVAAPVAETPPAARKVVAAADDQEAERRQLRLQDDLDPQILPIFLEESQDLIREIGGELRAWHAEPANTAIADQLMRLLHTFKGGARMAGAMSLGELLHSMETRVEQAVAASAVTPAFLDTFDTSFDRASMLLEQLQHGAEVPPEPLSPEAAEEPVVAPISEPVAPTPVRQHLIVEAETQARASLRVRADLVDQLVNGAGEMAIARGRIEGEMLALKTSLLDLTENVIRLRNQLREVEIQAESQMQSRQALTAEREGQFDPLEFDRFTRFQELTRMMAESVNDVATVQQNLLHNLDHANASITAQARLNRDLSQSLMSVRMVPFNTVADRLYRLVRQTAKELGKRANLDIRGGQTELDRSVLEKMTGPLEHLLRNAVSHGIEAPGGRVAAGKTEIGEIILTVGQVGNEVIISLDDDGAGLDYSRIRARAVESGLLAADAVADDQQLTQFIFQSGFSTAETVTEVFGRGVGMDVVRNETSSLGGRIEVSSPAGKGTEFRIFLPLTLAVTQAVLVSVGSRTYAIPASMVEQVNELKPNVMEAIRAEGATVWLGTRYPWHFLARLLGDASAQPHQQRRHWILLLKSGNQRIAIEVDNLLGNKEVVVKNIGPQLARVVGIAGATVLGSGEIALIVNPVALASREQRAAPGVAEAEAPPPLVVEAAPVTPPAATIMVVDDSLTVRKITGRLLAREGYQVVTAKDGVDALEQLLDIVPAVMLVDIEMPRMDGFDLSRNVRADPRLKDVPIIMITSRIADKHRNYATEIGVNHYLGKPYDEEELLGLIAGYVRGT